jgi:hypothetical protein
MGACSLPFEGFGNALPRAAVGCRPCRALRFNGSAPSGAGEEDDVMINYMKNHESQVREALERKPGPEAMRELLVLHETRTAWIQHERLVHLLTMLFVCLFALLALGYALERPSLPTFLLAGLLLILSAAYLLHYYRLENGVQRWYRMADDIRNGVRRG